DIGKNIVGVVLGCNNYEVIDLGVMVPADTILKTAVEKNVDVIGLSGLITPSLEEMVHVALEMERRGIGLPLLIGGATTSEIHTAVKIGPACSNPVIHVKDASRCVGVLSRLLSEADSGPYVSEIEKKYEALREKHERSRAASNLISLDLARQNRRKTAWDDVDIVKPAFIGNKNFTDYPLKEISRYIDWTFFFHAWKISGKYPAIFDDPVKGEEARKLFDDGQLMLKKIISEQMLRAEGVIGFYPAQADGDDVLLYDTEALKNTIGALHFLRNQERKDTGVPNLSLADFIAPKDSGKADYIGGFSVTAGVGIEKWVKLYESEGDDYSSFMLKIMADRLAEAFAELMHEKVRREFWGYDKSEQLDIQDLLREKYTGIRPAPGYPACPEHSEKRTLFDLLETEKNTSIRLTENFAMYPAASVSGYYFMHPFSQYFNLGKITREQVEDYAVRKGMDPDQAEKLLKPNLGY
ncbi:MAG TPA: vitamin B12 dependent-methionine synthase activation domain-containing protein, partial [Bacteroidales bacterium]|nr:vitamin B12 dependent-methionine synthase activation domain-containing protein [Bacteroidales bacterium]